MSETEANSGGTTTPVIFPPGPSQPEAQESEQPVTAEQESVGAGKGDSDYTVATSPQYNPDASKETEDRGFQYPTKLDEARNLVGGVYLDDVQREREEIIRAKFENREPDLKNPPATQSTPLVESTVLSRLDPRAKGRDADVTLPVSTDRTQARKDAESDKDSE